MICILAPQSCYALPAVGRLWPSVVDGVDEDDEDGDHDDHLAGVGVQFQVAMGIKREIAVWRGQGQTAGTK